MHVVASRAGSAYGVAIAYVATARFRVCANNRYWIIKEPHGTVKAWIQRPDSTGLRARGTAIPGLRFPIVTPLCAKPLYPFFGTLQPCVYSLPRYGGGEHRDTGYAVLRAG